MATFHPKHGFTTSAFKPCPTSASDRPRQRLRRLFRRALVRVPVHGEVGGAHGLDRDRAHQRLQSAAQPGVRGAGGREQDDGVVARRRTFRVGERHQAVGGDAAVRGEGGDHVRLAALQRAVMNDTEPAAADLAAFEDDLRGHRVRLLVYNRQASDAAARRLLDVARAAGVPVLGVTETEPARTTYQAWMLAQLDALDQALSPPAP